jgi:hypothetical protein
VSPYTVKIPSFAVCLELLSLSLSLFSLELCTGSCDVGVFSGSLWQHVQSSCYWDPLSLTLLLSPLQHFHRLLQWELPGSSVFHSLCLSSKVSFGFKICAVSLSFSMFGTERSRILRFWKLVRLQRTVGQASTVATALLWGRPNLSAPEAKPPFPIPL